MTVRILTGDCRDLLATLDAESVQTCVTSPPYFGLRDYGVAGQIGLETTPDAFVAELVSVFRDVRRVLRNDGTLWLNLGDSYASTGGERAYGSSDGGTGRGPGARRFRRTTFEGLDGGRGECHTEAAEIPLASWLHANALRPKNLLGIPWRVAFALQADGWYLRSDIIWHKPNPMPESVTDRPTKAHEYLFLLAKSERYYYDADAIAEPVTASTVERLSQPTLEQQRGSDRVPGKTNGPMKAVPPKRGGTKYGDSDAPEHRTKSGNVYDIGNGKRNRRTVWTVATQPFKGSHFATFPTSLVEPCILAGSKRGDTVLDPFGGAGTTGLVADRLGRNAVLCELNPQYAAMARARIHDDAPLFQDGAA